MPALDMPIEQLREYQGSTARPDDFDGYWNTALAQLDTVDPKWTIEPDPDFSVAGVDCLHLYFQSVGDVRVHCRMTCPKDRAGKSLPAVLKFHGYQGNCGQWTEQLPYSMNGCCFVSMDVRGQGGLTADLSQIDQGATFGGLVIRGIELDDPQRMLYRNVFLDTVQLARVVASFPFVDVDRISAMGFSQGGGLALACAALSRQICKVVSGYPYLSDYKRSWDMDVKTDAYKELHWYFRYRDPLHQKEEQFWKRMGYIDVQHLCDRIACPVLMFTALADDICLPSTQFAAYNKIRSTKEMLIYPEWKHENLPQAGDISYQYLLS